VGVVKWCGRSPATVVVGAAKKASPTALS